MLYELIHLRLVIKKKNIHISLVDLEYNGESTVEERDCKDFLKILKKFNILKVKSTGKQIKSCVVFTIKASVRQVLAV